MRTISFSAALAVLLAVTTTISAQTIDVLEPRPGAARYDEHVVVRVFPESKAELDAATSIADEVWSERLGVGPIEIQIDRTKLAALAEAGLDPVVLVDDVQALIDAEWAGIQAAARRAELGGPAPRGDAWYSTYYQLDDIHAYVESLAAARPDLATAFTAGLSLEGRNIQAISISAPDQPGNARADRPVVMFLGGQHAREWITPPTVVYLAENLIGRYDSDARVRDILDHNEVVIVTVMNPDGYVETWTGQRLWRKNKRGGYGVDLNRNWGYEWGREPGSSGDITSEIYRGADPFSEPETTVVRDLSLSYGSRLVGFTDVHAYSQLILWPFGYEDNAVTPEPDRTFFDELARELSTVIESVHGEFYDPIQAWLLYPAAGVSDDWYYGALGVRALAFELRPDTSSPGFLLPEGEILPTAEENWPAFLAYIERVTAPLTWSLAAPIPSEMTAGVATSVYVNAVGVAQTIDASTVLMRVSTNGGAPVVVPMIQQDAATFTGDVPAGVCGDELAITFEISTVEGGTYLFPDDGTSFAATVINVDVPFDDTMATDQGWIVGDPSDTAITGIWERADPVGTAAQPDSDHSGGDTLCYVTGASATDLGSNDIDGGRTTLTSPPIDVSAGDAEIHFYVWFSNDQGANIEQDTLIVSLSDDDGASWTVVETTNLSTEEWEPRSYLLSDHGLLPTSTVRLRVSAGDEDAGSIVEAAIDDVRATISSFCENLADLNGDGILDFFDVGIFLDLFSTGDLSVDFNGDGLLDFFDVSIFLDAYNGG